MRPDRLLLPAMLWLGIAWAAVEGRGDPPDAEVRLPAQSGYLLPVSNAQPEMPTPEPPAPPRSEVDAAQVSRGRAAFEQACTSCHDAERALGKSKSYSAWLGTVRRMAGKDGAEVPSSEVAPIAAYLASRSTTSRDLAPAEAAAEAESSGWTFGATVSTLHRSGSGGSSLENPGFFADVWVTAAYQSTGPWRANITVCTACHSTSTPLLGSALEVVEGSATLDLRHLLHGCRCDDDFEVHAKAGRFVVPFGAYAAMSHPGVYRTLSNPLMFNMGRRVFVAGSSPPNQPVLPMPFADEGVDLMIRMPVGSELKFTADLYAVNGLQGAAPNIFTLSRSYSDNNEEPAVGSRITLGGDFFRVGASVMSGNLQTQGLPGVDYILAGADATVQVSDRLRFYFENAMRQQDSLAFPGSEDETFGTLAQLEWQFFDRGRTSLLVRYDTLEHRSQSFGDATLQRFTWGFNVGLPGGSLLMLNHERWWPSQGNDVDVVGARWVVSL